PLGACRSLWCHPPCGREARDRRDVPARCRPTTRSRRARSRPRSGAGGSCDPPRGAHPRAVGARSAERRRPLAVASRPVRGLRLPLAARPRGTVSGAAPIRCLGIVNRGDAAGRCLRTSKSLRTREGSDLRGVVLYTAVDRDAPFVRHADAAVLLPARAGEVRAYLDHDLVIAALCRAGVDAVWPGWGFVAEDPAFAERVVAEGMRFLGPSGGAMRALGDKIAAKQVAERAGVPVAPWSGGAVGDSDEAVQCAGRLGYPVMVKAAAGGGGRGIPVVEHAAALPAAFRPPPAEAQAALRDRPL